MSERRLGARLTGKLTLLAASMRAGGVRVGVGELLSAHRALSAVDPLDREAAYFALRTILCSRHEDLAAFDAAFAEWFAPPQEVELPRDKDFAEYTDEERDRALRAMHRLAEVVPTKPRRRIQRAPPARRHAARGDGSTCAPRCAPPATRSSGTGASPASGPGRSWLVCDVSGSMEPYARMLLAYMQACVAARRRVEAFVFGTRLTRVTAELRGRDPGAALDCSGGTPIGEALATLNSEHGRRVGSGAVVVLLSDGWDRGDPGQLEREVARLARCSHRLIWLNPLMAHPDSPAVLSHVDEFMAANSLASLEELAARLHEVGA